jgi:hypothetical protein
MVRDNRNDYEMMTTSGWLGTFVHEEHHGWVTVMVMMMMTVMTMIINGSTQCDWKAIKIISEVF